MPKIRKPARKPAATVRVATSPNSTESEALQRMGSLLVVQGAEVDLGRHMLCDHPIVIGRDERADFSLRDGSISRAHCCVEIADNGKDYVLVDLESTNGTILNGHSVNERLEIHPGDKIFLGSSVLRFSYADSVDLKYYSRVEEMVHTDALTGLDSKRQYDAVFDIVSSQAIAEKSALTVFAMDMDGLKNINDTHGHEMGSFAITAVAEVMREVILSHGHLARFGGDEFVACFPTLQHQDALTIAEKLRAAIEANIFVREEIIIYPTMSIGVATYPEHGIPSELFKSADDALYRAKRSGKNCVESAS